MIASYWLINSEFHYKSKVVIIILILTLGINSVDCFVTLIRKVEANQLEEID